MSLEDFYGTVPDESVVWKVIDEACSIPKAQLNNTYSG